MVFWYIRTAWGFVSLRFHMFFLPQNPSKSWIYHAESYSYKSLFKHVCTKKAVHRHGIDLHKLHQINHDFLFSFTSFSWWLIGDLGPGGLDSDWIPLCFRDWDSLGIPRFEYESQTTKRPKPPNLRWQRAGSQEVWSLMPWKQRFGRWKKQVVE